MTKNKTNVCLDEFDKNVCWYTQGESTIARNIMPCFDEPKFKVTNKYNINES